MNKKKHLFRLFLLCQAAFVTSKNLSFNFPSKSLLNNYKSGMAIIRECDHNTLNTPTDNVIIVPKNFNIKKHSAVVGKGIDIFARASEYLFNFKMTNSLEWIKIIQSSDKDNNNLFTLSRFYNTNIFTLNPCRLICKKKGHLINSCIQ